MSKIKVSLLKRAGRPYFYMQYRDPETGDKVVKSTETSNRRDAERAAGKWERELQEGRESRGYGRMVWSEFRELYESQVLASLAARTDDKVTSVFNVLERTIKPKRLADVNENALSRYQAALRAKGRAETTIKGHLAHIMAALSWAKGQKLLNQLPEVAMPKRARKSKVMKGRAITTEEFERMLTKIEPALFPPGVKLEAEKRPAVVASWEYFLRGLWLSGLRLEESMTLHWQDRSALCVEGLDGRHPMLWVPGESEKGHQDRILPMAPEFAEFLRQTPVDEREGFVFNPLPRRHRYGSRISAHHAGLVVSAMGKLAGVKVNEDPKTGKVKYASAHDLRRSFGERWASRVMPNVLQELMRHENIQTTMRYYVGQNAQRTSAILWEAHTKTARSHGSSGSRSEPPDTDYGNQVDPVHTVNLG